MPKARADNTLSTDSRTARQTDALQFEIGVLLAEVAVVVKHAHDEKAVDLLWEQKGNSEIGDREIVCRKEVAPVACDPAPSSLTTADGSQNRMHSVVRRKIRRNFSIAIADLIVPHS